MIRDLNQLRGQTHRSDCGTDAMTCVDEVHSSGIGQIDSIFVYTAHLIDVSTTTLPGNLVTFWAFRRKRQIASQTLPSSCITFKTVLLLTLDCHARIHESRRVGCSCHFCVVVILKDTKK